MKTIDNVLREIRYGIIPKHRHDRELLMHFADRFEAAVKSLEVDRDNWRRQALDEDARANATHKDSLVVGDMAQMREALKAFVDYSDLVCKMGIFNRNSLIAITTKVREALAKPPRNCDKFNTPDKALSAYCEDKVIVRPLPLWYSNEYWAFLNWLLAETKGGSK